jgi:hypothetical protein
LAKNVAALAAAGVIDLDTLAQDGVRVRAAAGTSSYRRRGKVEERLKQARAVVARLKREVEEDPAATSERIKAARARAVREREARAAAALEKLKELEEERERREKTHAKQAAKQADPRVSLTDPEARMIKMPDGGFRPAYNMQIVSAVESQVIVGIDVTPSGSDGGLMRPMLESLQERGIVPKRHLADGGFTKSADIEWAHSTDPFAPREADGPGVRQWRQRMASEAGKACYKRRAIHECINARLRQWNLRQLTVRGSFKARMVLRWFALANNVLAAHRLTAADAAT